MKDCGTGAIALHPKVNAQGTYYFMSLTTSRLLNVQHFTPIPLPEEVINGMHLLACRNSNGLYVWYQNCCPLLDVTNYYDNNN